MPLTQENYGSVLRDCSRIIATDPTVEKAFYRSAVALVALERFIDAVDCCDRCLAINPDNDPVRALRDKAMKGEETRQRKAQELAAREHQQKLDAMRLSSLLKVICVRTTRGEITHQAYRSEMSSQSPDHLMDLLMLFISMMLLKRWYSLSGSCILNMASPT
jgi:hypothetical protein